MGEKSLFGFYINCGGWLMSSTKNMSFVMKMIAVMLLFSAKAFAASVSDDSWLDQIVTFVKVNLEGNFAYLIIIIGITIGFISALFGKWNVALTAFIGGVLIGSITFFAGMAQTMGGTFQ
jgi:type IV secretory pathway VirB2 component (pilin)